MTASHSFLNTVRRPARLAILLSLAACLLPVLARQAAAQAVPAATWPSGDTAPTEQPLEGQMLGTDLNLNQDVNAIAAENESFDKYALGVAALGGAQTNFFGTETDHITVGYLQLSGDAGLYLRNARTHFFALYSPQYNIYPQYSAVNSYDQRYYQTLEHLFSEHVVVGWDVTGGRYLSLNQYLPQGLNIGGIGVVVPALGTALYEDSFQITNAATSLRLRWLMSTRMTFTADATAGYFLLVPTDRAFSSEYGERFIPTGANLKLMYQLTSKDAIGGAMTAVYFYGLSPRGHATVEAPQFLYERQLTAVLKVAAGAGPLFVQSSGTTQPGLTSPAYKDTSYALNASISRQVRQSQFSLAYNRAFFVSFLSPGIIAHQVSFTGYVPLAHRWILTSAASYIRENSSAYGGTIYGGSAQMSYVIGPRTELYGLYSVYSQNFSNGTANSYGFARNKFGAGIRFTLGNPTTPGGTQ